MAEIKFTDASLPAEQVGVKWNELRDNKAILDQSGWTHYQRATLTFCREWLMGETQFTVNTSGTTGPPKLIILTRKQMHWSAQQTVNLLGLKQGYNVLVCLSVEHIAGKMMLVRCFDFGMNPTIIEPTNDPMLAIDANHTYDFIAMVPMQLSAVLQNEESITKLNRFKLVLLGGAGLNAEIEEKAKELSVPVYHSYGMTETCSHIGLRLLNGPNPQTAMHPLPEVQLKQDERGCLMINAPSSGGIWLTTNDIVEFYPDGSFNLIGRADNIINSGGVKIQLEKIERAANEVLTEMGQYTSVLCSGQQDMILGERLVLILETTKWDKTQTARLLKKLKAKLTRYEVPKHVLLVDEFAYSPTGKPDRDKTLQKAVAEIEG